MKKFPVMITTVNGNCKRSLTMAQIEVCFITSAKSGIEKHRKYFNLQMTFYGGEFAKGVIVKKIPNGYLNKFLIAKS